MSPSHTLHPLKTAWAGIVPLEDGTGYLILGCQPGESRPLGILPKITIVTDRTPTMAYKRLVDLTSQSWCLAMRESDLINLDGAHWTQLVRGIPRIKMVSNRLWVWAEAIWEEAGEDLPYGLDRSRARWLALTAAQDEEAWLREEEIPF